MESEQQWLAGYAVAAAADIDLHVSPLGAAMIDSPNSELRREVPSHNTVILFWFNRKICGRCLRARLINSEVLLVLSAVEAPGGKLAPLAPCCA